MICFAFPNLLRLDLFRESPGALEERLWKRYNWEFTPENETCSCWWVANLENEDQTVDAKLICRSLACVRMELCAARLATSQKLRQEWDKRLENNSQAVDRIQENRDLWLHAGGCDPELLNTPTEIHLEACADRANSQRHVGKIWAARRS